MYFGFSEDVNFLNILFKKLKKNQINNELKIDQNEIKLRKENSKKGFKWLSCCGNEFNFIRAFCNKFGHGLIEHFLVLDELTYGGSLRKKFEPDRLKIDQKTGWLFHPSPSDKNHGRYSLISDTILLDSLQDTIDLEAGRVRWAGKTFDILPLDSDDI
ncbi:hypothetical protein O181_030776 [Austropuccinia psidii MF-1]|uniref:Uncharacterized protein n=1 Tax=Austropuccinia psidii MF-1 TaxID=1389203 RepID=A0A9Q3CZ54_9BASI|nr:hypothetical protein [Austropuccinia psidii MF-1]